MSLFFGRFPKQMATVKSTFHFTFKRLKDSRMQVFTASYYSLAVNCIGNYTLLDGFSVVEGCVLHIYMD